MSTSPFPTEPGQFEPSQQNEQLQRPTQPLTQQPSHNQTQPYQEALSQPLPQQYMPQPPMLPLPQPPKKRSRRNLWIAIVAIILIVFAIVGIMQLATPTPTKPVPQAGQPTNAADSAQQTATDTSFQQTAVAVSNSITPIPTKTQAQTESDYKNSAVSATVASLDKDGSADTGDIVHFTATIIGFVKDSSGITAGANVTTSDTSSVVQVLFPSGTDLSQLNQQDTIEVWGTDEGSFSGTNAYGGTVQEVAISAVYLLDQTTNYQAKS